MKKAHLIASLLLIALLWALSWLAYWFQRPSPATRPVQIAHRGGAGRNPENTLRAFSASAQADFWETDLRLTCDGLVVLMHDGSVNRTTDGKGPIEKMTAAQVAALRSQGEPVPSWPQLVELARPLKVGLLPEVKGRSAGLEEAMLAALDPVMRERTVVSSFSWASLNKVNQLAPEVRLCRLYYPWRLWIGDNPPHTLVVSPMAETVLLHPWLIKQAHDRGYQIWPWFAGLENGWTVKLLLELGVDGLMRDN